MKEETISEDNMQAAIIGMWKSGACINEICELINKSKRYVEGKIKNYYYNKKETSCKSSIHENHITFLIPSYLTLKDLPCYQ